MSSKKKKIKSGKKKYNDVSPPQSTISNEDESKSLDIETAKLQYGEVLSSISNAEANIDECDESSLAKSLCDAIESLFKALPLVEGSEPEAKELAYRMKKTIASCYDTLADCQDRELTLTEVSLCENLLISALKDAASEKQTAICYEALARVTLRRMENDNTCGGDLIQSKTMLDKCTNAVMQVKVDDDEIITLQAACTCYVKKSHKYCTIDRMLQQSPEVQDDGGDDDNTSMPPQSSRDIAGGKRACNEGVSLFKVGNYSAALTKFEEALSLVQGQEDKAVPVACQLRHNIVSCALELAKQEQRDLSKDECDELFGHVRLALCCNLPEILVVKFCDKAALLCLRRMEDPSASPQKVVESNLRLVEAISFVRKSTLDGIEHHKELCDGYEKKALEIMKELVTDPEKMDIDASEVVIPDIEITDEFGELSFLWNHYAVPFEYIEECQQLLKEVASGKDLNEAEKAILLMYQVLKNDHDRKLSPDPDQIVEGNLEGWKKWEAAMNETENYKGRTNSSDKLSKDTDIATNLHWGTPICIEKTKEKGTNCIWDANGCIVFAIKSIPSSLHNEACGVRLNEDDFAKIRKRIVVVDHHCGIPLTKDGHANEFNHQLPNELGISKKRYNLFCILAGSHHPCYHAALGKGPLPTISMSVPVHETRYGSSDRFKTDKLLYCGNSFHPENGNAGYLGNSLVWTPARLSYCSSSIALCYKNVTGLRVPDVSRLSERFAGVDGMTALEMLERAERCRADCVRGGKHCQQNRKELNELTQKLVSAKSSRAKRRAQSDLIQAIKVNSISDKKRGKSLQAGVLGLLAYHNQLGMDSDIISSLSSALGVNPTVPRMTYELGRKPYINSVTKQPGALKYDDGRELHINSVTKQPGALKLSDGREKGSGMTSVAAGTRERHINSKTKLPGALKLSDGREKGSGRRGVESDMMDEACRLMQTKEYTSMKKGAAEQAALEAAGFRFDEEGTQKERKDQFRKVTLAARRVTLSTRVKKATKG